MLTVYIPVGISGSGKSRYYKKVLKTQDSKIKKICPDDIRKKFTGDCSDQSMNMDVWMEAYHELEDFVSKKQSVFFSSTNLSIKSITKIIDTVTAITSKVAFKILVLSDSNNEELCRQRVKTDLENGVDRSNTLKLVDNLDGHLLDYDYVHKQFLDFQEVKIKFF